MPTPPPTKADCELTIKVVEEKLLAGFRPPGVNGRGHAALQEAADDPRINLQQGSTVGKRLAAAARHHGLVPNWDLWQSPDHGPDFASRAAAQQGLAGDYDVNFPIPDGMTSRGVSILYGDDGEVRGAWSKSRAAGADPDDIVKIADPKKVVSTATLFDNQGRVTQQWVRERPEDVAREAAWRRYAEDLASEMPRAAPIPPPPATSTDLLACYPVGDHHFGMLSWEPETGADYDLAIAERLLCDATDYLVSATPACQQSLIVFLGDLLHYDSLEAVTPTSRNVLDADSRYPKMVGVAVRAMRYMIDAALRHHQGVHVIVEIGNHDLSSSIFLMLCISCIYENEPRVTVDTSPSHFHYFEFGSCLIGTHHGHGVKMERLPIVMASDRPEEWGRTRYRYWMTGHIHHRSAQDFPGCSVESFRVLPPEDAWASQKGYRAARDMKAIVFHRDHGEVERRTVNPRMLDVPDEKRMAA